MFLESSYVFLSTSFAYVTAPYYKMYSCRYFPSTQQATKEYNGIAVYSTAWSKFWTILVKAK